MIRGQELLQCLDGRHRFARSPIQDGIHSAMVDQKPANVTDFCEASFNLPELAFDEDG